jgi:hypothetical protein
MKPGPTAPLDFHRTKIDQRAAAKIFALRFPQNGGEPMTTAMLAKRFGVDQKTICILLRRVVAEKGRGGK